MQKDHFVDIITYADEGEFQLLRRGVEGIRGAETLAHIYYPTKYWERKDKKEDTAAFIAPPYEIVISVITSAIGILQLAELLHRYLRRRSRWRFEGSSFKSTPRYARIRLNGKEIIVKANRSVPQLEVILLKYSKSLSSNEKAIKARKLNIQKKRRLQEKIEEVKSARDSIGRADKAASARLDRLMDLYTKRLRDVETRLSAVNKHKDKR